MENKLRKTVSEQFQIKSNNLKKEKKID